MSLQPNPISEGQYNRLIKWLRSELAHFKREKDYLYFVNLIDEVANVDPSPSGKYVQWILKQIIANRLTVPDDFVVLSKTLITFRRIAGRLPIQHRRIESYHNFSELFRIIEEYLPKTLSKRERREAGTHLIHADETYELYELTTPEAAVAASRNTAWCTCDYETAQKYLADANLYVIYKNNKRFLLAHPASREVMVTDNSPYEENDPQLLAVFEKHLSVLYCASHKSFKNKKCYSCGEFGCCGYSQCAEEGCPEWMCGSNAECGAQCKTCEVWFCHDHVVDECNGCEGQGAYHLCRECYEECPNCKGPMCVDHQTACDICEERNCDECIQKCYECGLNYCLGHCRFECANCNVEKCMQCATKTVMPYGEYDTECMVCHHSSCQDCMYDCVSCDRRACHSCIDEDNICNDCTS
jgi:hypothetical protein